MLYEELLKEEKELKEIIEKTAKALARVPEGNLRVTQGRKTPQYYYKTQENALDFPEGKYLKQSEVELAKALAQRDYDRKILGLAKNQLRQIQKLIPYYEEHMLQFVYERMHASRQELVIPRILSDKQYIENWMKKEYKSKKIDEQLAKIITNRGEQVRSKSEKIIADMLDKQNVPYRYEASLLLQGMGIIHPDFTVLNVRKRKEIYWEHFGMMDNKDYCENALRRIERYQRNGILIGDRLIITYETVKYPLETDMIERNIREYCMK